MLEIYTKLTSRVIVVDNLYCTSGIQTPSVNGEILEASSQISLVHRISWINLKNYFPSLLLDPKSVQVPSTLIVVLMGKCVFLWPTQTKAQLILLHRNSV